MCVGTCFISLYGHFLKKFPGCLESIWGVFAFLGCSEVLMPIECNLLLMLFFVFLPIFVGCVGSETEPEW